MKNGKKSASVERLVPSEDPMKRIDELEKQVHFLRMENDYLKKLNALVQEKERSQKPKKKRL